MERSRVWIVTHSRGLVLRDGSPMLVAEDLTTLEIEMPSGHRVGMLGDHAVWVCSLEGDLPPRYSQAGLRALYGAVSDEVLVAAMRAAQIATFHDTHRFCGRCATPTLPVEGEHSVRCPACELSVYPRISPAVIALIRRGDQALLARSPRFPAPFYSTLAGFVEVGESLEQALSREVREEVGIEIGSIRYFGSQPWPFPHQLMIGFTAEWKGGEIRVDGDEIADAQWFDADALPTVPPPFSIARQLIDAWVREVRGQP